MGAVGFAQQGEQRVKNPSGFRLYPQASSNLANRVPPSPSPMMSTNA
jgi:hypothetical protein